MSLQNSRKLFAILPSPENESVACNPTNSTFTDYGSSDT